MIIIKNLNPYVVSNSESVGEALSKIDKNKHKFIYVVDDKNRLIGSLTDGDIRRSIIASGGLNVNHKLDEIVNQNCFSLPYDSLDSDIEKAFNEKINSIPLIDSNNHLIAIAEAKLLNITIEGYSISKESPAFIISEIGNNHQGSLSLAKKLIDIAVDSGANCAKFQMRNLESLYKNNGDKDDISADLGAQYTLNLLSKFQLSDRDLFLAFDYCKSKNIVPLCTPWDAESLNKLEAYGMQAYKIASADLTNFPLLGLAAKTGKPLICSTGMSTESEIVSAISFLKSKKAQFILLHCNSTYPTPYKDVNLNYLRRLSELTGGVVGYSGHERGFSIPLCAVALGAKIIEKHITLDKELEGNDHKVSLVADEFKVMVAQIRNVEEAMGSGSSRQVTQGELINREVLSKSLVASRPIFEGETIDLEMIEVKSPGHGLPPYRINDLVGLVIGRKLKKGDFFFESDISGLVSKKNIYKFNRPYGIPVRYHDYNNLTNNIKLDFVEFHLSYSDLEIDPNRHIRSANGLDFVVHAPELFSGDHILDLCSHDRDYRKRSMHEFERVIIHTLKLNEIFKKTTKPVIILNAGGWSREEFLKPQAVEEKYKILKDTLSDINMRQTEIAIQTMPPFPWHFGGQSHHNLFVSPFEIENFCRETGYKICLDISHSMMACNYFKWDIYKFIKIISPHVIHLHVVDAKGADGEGVQMGYGDIDFHKLGKILDAECPNIPFVPEVWQGHKNDGEGFWAALSYLERSFKGVTR